MERQRVECNLTPDCPYFEEGGRMDTHHKYHPRRDYRTRIEKLFRSLEVNLVETCVCLHRIDHAQNPPPPKPSREFMLSEIQRWNESQH